MEAAEAQWVELCARGDAHDDQSLDRQLRAWGPRAELVPGSLEPLAGRPFSLGVTQDGVTLTEFEGILEFTSVVRAVEINGARCVAKMSLRAEPALEWELELVEHLSGFGLCPRIVRTEDGRTHEGPLFVMEWVQGDAGPGFTADLDWERLEAQALVQVHEATRGWSQCPTVASAYELIEHTDVGDIDLKSVPADVLELCREAWAQLPEEPLCVIHGDPGADNVVVTESDRVVLLDWAAARVDHPWFDWAHVDAAATGLSPPERRKAVCASDAWCVATEWESDPVWAENRLEVLQGLMRAR